MPLRTVAIINQKGGVGKTTTTANLAHALALAGKKVTVVDLDPQCHLSISLGLLEAQSGIDEVLLEEANIEDMVRISRDNLRIVPAGHRLNEIEQLTEGGAKRGNLLRNALSGKFTDQDFLLLDCPPSSGILAVNALFAADELLIPMTGEYLALQGLAHLMATIRMFESALKRKFLLKVVVTRLHVARRLARDVLKTLRRHFPNDILATPIREAAVLAECPSIGKTILEYRPGSRSAGEFRKLAEDLITGRMMAWQNE